MNCVRENTFERKIKYSKFDNFILFLFSLYFILKPFYFWSSGLPQIADFILIFLMFVFFIKKRFRINFSVDAKSFLITGTLFVSYIIFVNLAWTFLLSSSYSFIIASLFYIYNFLAAVLVISLFTEYKDKLFKVIYKALFFSILIQMFTFFLGGGYTGGRMTGSFNNPNQLGYYALLVISIFMFLSNRINMKVKWFILGIFASLLLVFTSLSKSAIISSIGIIISFLIFKNKNKMFKRRLILSIFVIILVLIYVYQTTNLIQDNHLLQSVQNRISAIGQDNDDSLDGRGYYRIIDYPEYWIFGAGEGEYSRFRASTIEFHSTLGNIQVSYGIIGSVLFLRLLYLALKNDNFKSWYIIVFLLIYGIAHNGIRNSLFWILLSMILMEFSSRTEKVSKKF